VAQRGKSGLSNTVTGLLFLAAVFIYPLMRGIGTGVSLSKYYVLYPVAAPALIMIGFLMLKNVLKLNLEDLSETLPACMTLIITPLTFNIAHGIAFGVISYPIVKLISGKYKEVTPLMYILAAGFILYYIFA
jgi:AGZA family xanthine/uracil permease-like MFS transporter